VQKLREIGIFPTALGVSRRSADSDDERSKISLFANVREEGVISMWDVDSIYKVPQMLNKQGLGSHRLRRVGFGFAACRSVGLAKLVTALENPQHQITIGMVGNMSI